MYVFVGQMKCHLHLSTNVYVRTKSQTRANKTFQDCCNIASMLCHRGCSYFSRKLLQKCAISWLQLLWSDPVVKELSLRSEHPGFKTPAFWQLNLFLVVPGSTSRLNLSMSSNVIVNVNIWTMSLPWHWHLQFPWPAPVWPCSPVGRAAVSGLGVVGSFPTLVVVFLCPCVGPFP